MFLFLLDAIVFENFHVNYPFIFELDSRSNINWRQISEIPSVFACMLGVCMWLNFSQIGGEVMYIYWPVILIGVSQLLLNLLKSSDSSVKQLSVFLLFAPIPGFFYSSSRQWMLVSLWRLVSAPFYPVEFRDFFLGDMFCSETYAMGNLEVYFCLYRNFWKYPDQCNSGHSYLLGFFSTLPGIWRALQCLRRYRDTYNLYPHVANFGKYMCT